MFDCSVIMFNQTTGVNRLFEIGFPYMNLSRLLRTAMLHNIFESVLGSFVVLSGLLNCIDFVLKQIKFPRGIFIREFEV